VSAFFQGHPDDGPSRLPFRRAETRRPVNYLGQRTPVVLVEVDDLVVAERRTAVDARHLERHVVTCRVKISSRRSTMSKLVTDSALLSPKTASSAGNLASLPSERVRTSAGRSPRTTVWRTIRGPASSTTQTPVMDDGRLVN
jgi:hypothetical protein